MANKNSSIDTPEIELVAIYKEKNRKNILATFHVYLSDKDIDIRGGKIFKLRNGKLFIQMPQGYGTDEITGGKISFPILSFTDAEYEKKVRYEIIKVVTKECKKMKLT